MDCAAEPSIHVYPPRRRMVCGPGEHATTVRRWLAPYVQRPAIAYGALALIIIVLLLDWSPTPAARSWITTPLLIAMAVLGLEVLRRQAAREFPADSGTRGL
jgi:hypothetical protein